MNNNQTENRDMNVRCRDTGQCTTKVRRRKTSGGRRGVSTLWLIITAPVFVIALCFVIEIGNVWLARAELKSALESAALAAAKEWKDSGDTDSAREIAIAYAAANEVGGESLILNSNAGGDGDNDNDQCIGDIVLGEVTGTAGNLTFDAQTSPDPNNGRFGVRTQAAITVEPVCLSVLGGAVGPFSVSGQATAACTAPDGTPQLVRIAVFDCDN